MALPNIYHHRKVADSSAKSCYICYKPSTSVLITPDNKDFFYTCPTHLKERNFCSPIIDTEAEAEKKRKEEMEREVEKVKKEFEERQARRKKKGKEKKEKKEEEKEDEDKKEERERDEKIESIQKAGAGAGGKGESKAEDDAPRIYSLHKTFYQMRVDRLRNIEIAKRNRERLRNPGAFPSTPKDDI